MNRYSIDKKPTDVMLLMAEKHKLIRKKAGYSQSEAALRSGVSLGSLKRFETTGQISLESLCLLADLYDRLKDFEVIFQQDDLSEIEKYFSKNTK
jgi:transcriptional regulator with XRE-family HTH domain